MANDSADQAQNPQQTTGGTGTQIAPAPKASPTKPRQRPRHLPRYKLLLHNDEINAMDEVVRAIVMLTPLTPEDAIRKMLEAHTTKVALLLTTHKERGELYVDQFASLKITTSLEPEA